MLRLVRCSYCGRRIWPWQRLGWYVHDDRTVGYWHSSCGRGRR